MDAPERIWIDNGRAYVPTDPRVAMPGVEYVRADLYAKLEVAEARQAEKVATLEQERDEWREVAADRGVKLIADAVTIRNLRAAIRWAATHTLGVSELMVWCREFPEITDLVVEAGEALADEGESWDRDPTDNPTQGKTRTLPLRRDTEGE